MVDTLAFAELLKKECTQDVIKRILKDAKDSGNKDVLVGGNKDDKIHMLIEALERGVVSWDDAFNMLRFSEENGRQHIFLYRPKKPQVLNQFSDGEQIAASIWGPDWKSQYKFPRFEILPKATVPADFRYEVSKDERKVGWIFIFYGRRRRMELIENVEKGDMLRKVWKIEVVRTVYMVRLGPSGILEVRVPQSDSTREIISMLNETRALLRPSGIWAGFSELPLVTMLTRLAKKRELLRNMYSLGIIRLRDASGGTSIFSPPQENDDITAIKNYNDALRMLLQADNRCNMVGVTWKKDASGGILEEDLFVKYRVSSDHDMSVGAKATPGAIDYAIRGLLSIKD